jgi:beta-lactamase regulating signal transducer with metallopeptidase domain
MVNLIMYLLESSALLAFFYLIYILVLRKETFFNLNRLFLLGSLIVSSLFPLVSINFIPAKVIAVERPIQEISKIRMSYYEAIALWEFESSAGRSRDVASVENKSVISTTNWIHLIRTILLVVYGVGIVVCLFRTVWTIRWIRKMINISVKEVRDGVTVIKLRHPTAPFSFFKYVFVHDAMVNTPEFDHILAHEKTHIKQRHSIDLIFVQLLAAFFWFNPVIWRLLKSLKTTHEYIADKKIISTGYSLVEYQTLLLKQLISNNSFGLVHNFNLSFIKKRITMMKNKRSGWSGKVRVALAITTSIICSALIIQCNSRLDEDASSDSVKPSNNEFIASINLPMLPKMGGTFDGDTADVLNFTISEYKLTINGEAYQLDEIISMIKSGGVPSVKGHVVMRIDKDQKMDFVRNVEMELRKADRRKVLYVGQTADGAKVETPIVLPPTPGYIAKNGVPEQPTISQVEAEGKTDILKIDAGDNAGIANQKMVYDFVKKHMQKQSTEYVVSLRYDADDKYNVYLPNLIYVKEGFNQIYQERSQDLFGKNYYAITREEYNAVRKNVPMAISIAEK